MLKKISYYHPDSPYALMKFQNDLLHYLKIKHKNKSSLVIVCIGTDRATGDCLGPLVGQALLPSPQYSVFGTLKEPIHAKNLNQTFKEIYSVCQNPFIIAVDSLSRLCTACWMYYTLPSPTTSWPRRFKTTPTDRTIINHWNCKCLF